MRNDYLKEQGLPYSVIMNFNNGKVCWNIKLIKIDILFFTTISLVQFDMIHNAKHYKKSNATFTTFSQQILRILKHVLLDLATGAWMHPN